LSGFLLGVPVLSAYRASSRELNESDSLRFETELFYLIYFLQCWELNTGLVHTRQALPLNYTLAQNSNFFPFETSSHYVTQAGLELVILLLLSLEFWDYSCALLCLAN
jgi:hypothetical protein